MTERGLLIVVSGPSGVGKDAVLEKFLPAGVDCERLVTATTRAPRIGEADGRDYHFLTREEFLERAATAGMFEYTEYNGNFYGTPKKGVEKKLAAGRSVIFKIEVNGALEIKRQYPDAVLIFIAPPSWQALEKRLLNRGTESAEESAGRLLAARFELSKASEYDYIVINDEIERCCEQLSAVIAAEKCKAVRREIFLKEITGNA